MEEFKPKLCFICHEITSDDNCRIVEDSIKGALDILLFKGPIEVNTSVICRACYTKVIEAFRFKEICTGTENIICPYVNSENGTPIDLKQIYLKERGGDRLRSVSDDDRICRLCLQIATSGFTYVRDLENGLLCQYIPEVNFNSTEEPIICMACIKSLKTHSDFLRNSFGIQKFENVPEDEPTGNQIHVKTEVMELKHEEGDEDTSCFGVQKFENVPEDEPMESEFHVKTEEIEIKEDNDDIDTLLPAEEPVVSVVKMYKCDACNYQSKYKKSLTPHGLKHKDASQIQMYKCDKCSYESKYKSNFLRHQQTHMDISEVRMYKCDTCDFETKQKGYIATHNLLHKDVSQVQMYKCTACSFETKYYRNFLKHQLTHKDVSEVQMYKCEICNFETRYRRTLTNHLLGHKDVSEVQMYKCDMCRYETKFKKYLVAHRRIHKVQTYKCNVCNLQTKHKVDFLKHQITHRTLVPRPL